MMMVMMMMENGVGDDDGDEGGCRWRMMLENDGDDGE